MDVERKQFEAKVQSVDEGTITALVSCFNNRDRAGEVVKPGAFKASLEKKMPKGVWAHQWDKPIAKTLEAYETGEGLVVKAKFNLDTQVGREAYSNIKEGIIDEFSIGYRVVKDSVDKEKGARNLDELELFEWSPVLTGMNEATRLLSVKHAAASKESDMPSVDTADEATKANRPNFGGNPAGSLAEVKVDRRGLGQQLVESKEYQDFLRSHSRGSESGSVTLDVGLKTLMLTTTGWPVESTRAPVVVPYATRMPEITDVIPTVSTNQNAFVYMEHTTFTNAAVETAEGAAKPEAALALTERTSPVRKIPVWIPVTDEQLEDVPGIQAWIESQLAFMVRQRLDTEIVSGSGITPNLLGIMNVVGVQTQAKGTDPTPDAIFKAMTKVRVTGRARPSAVLIHPNDWAEVQLLRTTDGIYIAGSPWDSGPSRIWGVPVVVSDAVVEGTAITGDFQNYTLLAERKQMTIKVGYQNDDFIKNQRSIVAEIRVAFVVTRPTAICLVTGV